MYWIKVCKSLTPFKQDASYVRISNNKDCSEMENLEYFTLFTFIGCSGSPTRAVF